MNNNDMLLKIMQEVNVIAKSYGFINGKDWARHAQEAGDISYHTYSEFEECHNLRNILGHPGATSITVSDVTICNAKSFLSTIRESTLRKHRAKPKLPDGTFRAKPFTKEFHWKGYENREYYFRFQIVQEYQKRAYDDGTRFEGWGYSIYVKEAPYKQWCIDHNTDYEFHFYNQPVDNPSICWNKLITDFSDANAVMVEWSNRYKTILDRLFQNKSIDESKLNHSSQRRGILPTGTFRFAKQHKTKTIYIEKKVYSKIMNILGKRKPELGGMLGWRDDQDYIDTFIFDRNAKVGSSEYSPNTDFLMNVMNNEWESQDIYLAGFVHSHPGNCNQLSNPDIEYAQRIMEAFDMKYIFMPIVTSDFTSKASFNPYIIHSSGYVTRCNIEVYSDEESIEGADTIDSEKMEQIRAEFEKMKNVSPIYEDVTRPIPSHSQEDTFARVSSVIDIKHMESCALWGIGCGGARNFYEDMARVGVGHFFLMDGDISSKSNIASQNGYLSEIGKSKVDVVKNHILDINDQINVLTFNMMLNDDVSDEWVESNIIEQCNVKHLLICAFTDDFFAQARAQKIAKRFNVPFLSAQHHQFGETSELIYWYPDISQYSAEEILKDRYQAYHNGFKNDVTSIGSPIFNTTRLNSLCEKIATGILLFSAHPESVYCSFLAEQKDKNLILIRQKPLAGTNSPLIDAFVEDEGLFFDDVVWINPKDII